MTRKYFTVFFSIITALAVLLPAGQAEAADGYAVFADSTESGPGSDVPVQFYLSNETSLSSVTVPIQYDQTLVTLKSISFTDSRAQHIANKVLTPANPAEAEGHFLVAIFQWMEDPIPAGDGLLFTALFSINPGATIGTETALDSLFYPPGGALEVVPTGSPIGLTPEFRPGQIMVGENNRPPLFASLPDQYILEGDSLELTVTVSDPDQDNLTIAATSKPIGATFVDNGDGTARLVWVPDHVGPNSADGSPVATSFWASDGDLSAQLNLVIHVLNSNRKPIINAPQQLMVEAGERLDVSISAVDPDFEPVSWSWTGLPDGASFDAANPGRIDWQSVVTDTGSFDMEFVAIDPQGLADTVIIQTSIMAVALYTLALDSVAAFPNEDVEVDLILDNKLDVAGFNLLIHHDPSALTYLSLSNEGTRAESFEYFVVHPDENSIAGNIRVIGVADIGGGALPLAPATGPIATARFRVSGDLAFAGMSLPLTFRFDDAPIDDDNTLTAPGGTRINQDELVYVGGEIKIHDLGQIRVGDINLNGIAAEIGDVIYFTNHFINPTLYTFNALQYANSDVNRDYIAATVSDLVALINWVVTGNGYAKVSGEAGLEATVRTEADNGWPVISVDSRSDIGAIYLEIESESEFSDNPVDNLVKPMTMETSADQNRLKVLIYSLEGDAIPAGLNELIGLPGLDDFEITHMELGSRDGQTIEALLGAPSAGLPTSFELGQNYPNPFNPETSIEFALPKSSFVELTVYNVLGQVVASIAEGTFPAGNHKVVWDGTDRDGQTVASGLYLYRLTAGAETMTRKMMLLK